MTHPARKFFVTIFVTFAVAYLASIASAAWQDKDTPAEDAPAVAKAKKDESIEDQQQRILGSYAELEQKFLALRDFEIDNNPARAKLLRRAYELSQEQGTTEGMKRILAMLSTGDLRDAEVSQKKVLDDLKGLLTLLQSEDRGKRIQDELKRNQEYLKEVERLLRIQKSLRGETEGKGDTPRISKSQKQAAERAKKLDEKIRENEERSADESDSPESDSSDSEGAKGKRPNDGGKGNEDADRKGKGKEQGNAKGQPQPQEGNPSDAGSSENDAEQKSAEQEMNPVRRRVAAAEKRMRAAKKKLDQAKRDESIKDMNEAIRELEAAKKELEEILRQLREEEVERSLSMLEGRFRKMMEREIKVRDQTKSLNAVVPEQRLADFEIKAGKLSAEQRSIATEASRALLLLREDGSSIAFPQTVEEMKLDMEQVASRLSASKVGEMTIEIENDVIETLGNLIEALAQAQKENEAKRKNQGKGQPGSGQPGDSSLVGKIAEIKMLRALQDRIYRRHTRYAKMLDDPNDPIGPTDNPDIRSALRRLTAKQKQLTEITKEIVESMSE
ncbi:hypothetical protein [Mariniblastus fucicola]|uniref:Chromosome partition protein Smc n=1 Tax=Mariniblastus fucicola TaxID=980251 RepID=A0A5B9PBV2_9BACT|nr:hypothetical protein [Mariniblastus fucicola]QEG22530.1 hypothetical protein MFFC18_24110 [Mariniblastus fucicola]